MTLASNKCEPALRERGSEPRLTRRRFLAGGAGLRRLVGNRNRGLCRRHRAAGLIVTRYALDAARLAGGPQAHHHGDRRPACRRARHDAAACQAAWSTPPMLLQSDLIVLLGDFKAWYSLQDRTGCRPAIWAAELARLRRRSAPGPSSAITIGGTISTACAARSPMCASRSWRTTRCCSAQHGQQFWLAGLGDQLAHRLGHGRFRGVDDLPGTLAQITTDDPVLLLAHEPDIFPKVPPRVALTLAGHTHGGQIRVPLLWQHFVPSQYGARFAYGHVDRGRSASDRFGRARHQHHSGAARRAAGNRAHHARRVSLSRSREKQTAPTKAGAAIHSAVARRSVQFTRRLCSEPS